MTTQDVYNIQKCYNINVEHGCKHNDDAPLLDLWVQDCVSSDDECVTNVVPAIKNTVPVNENIKGIVSETVSNLGSKNFEEKDENTLAEIKNNKTPQTSFKDVDEGTINLPANIKIVIQKMSSHSTQKKLKQKKKLKNSCHEETIEIHTVLEDGKYIYISNNCENDHQY